MPIKIIKNPCPWEYGWIAVEDANASPDFRTNLGSIYLTDGMLRTDSPHNSVMAALEHFAQEQGLPYSRTVGFPTWSFDFDDNWEPGESDSSEEGDTYVLSEKEEEKVQDLLDKYVGH